MLKILLSERDVHEMTGLSRSTRYRLEREGRFPKKIKISKGRVAWDAHAINLWLSGLGVDVKKNSSSKECIENLSQTVNLPRGVR